MPTLLFCSAIDPIEQWRPALVQLMPDLNIRVYPDVGEVAEIDYALVWKPPHGLLASLPNLRLIHSIGAGVDPLLKDPSLPSNIPLVRMVDNCLRRMMSEYAIYAVLHFHRAMPTYLAQQKTGNWSRHWPAMTLQSPVGVLGLGAIGQDIAQKFAALEFPTLGWSRSPKTVADVTCYHGEAGLGTLLAACRYIICVLPLTAETTGLIDKKFIDRMQSGSYLINIGRGGHIVDADLLAALDSGKLAGACLDVFNEEPLPENDPYWRHPKVHATPHIAAETDPGEGAQEVVKNIQRLEQGEDLPTLVQLDKGY